MASNFHPCGGPPVASEFNPMHARFVLLPLLLAAGAGSALADDARVAVAANFSRSAEQLVAQFEQSQAHEIELVSGSSARFYAQLRSGAPFDVFLSADQVKPALLAEEGLAVPESRYTYAVGRLVLWTAEPSQAISSESLSWDGGGKVALANPRLAPYGLAASEAIDNLGLSEIVAERLIMGENISQAYQFVATGNAPLGFVALSQVGRNGNIEHGSGWLVPAELHSPIRQDAILLNESNAAAGAFLDYLRSAEARRIIHSFGYTTEESAP